MSGRQVGVRRTGEVQRELENMYFRLGFVKGNLDQEIFVFWFCAWK